MGLPPRWKIGDLQSSLGEVPVIALNAVNSTITSAPIDLGANSVALYCQFADPDTLCDIVVSNLIGGSYVPVATFLGVGLFTSSNLFVGQLDQNITLQGQPITITAQNFRSTIGGTAGTVTINVSRLN
jgi:hypothetical protein